MTATLKGERELSLMRFRYVRSWYILLVLLVSFRLGNLGFVFPRAYVSLFARILKGAAEKFPGPRRGARNACQYRAPVRGSGASLHVEILERLSLGVFYRALGGGRGVAQGGAPEGRR